MSTALVALLVGIGVLPGLNQAAMVTLSLEQLSQEADTVVLGTVTMQVSTWNHQHTAIQTDVTVTIEDTVKGLQSAEVTFRIAGGAVGDVGMRTSNDPVFQNGDRVILFLNTKGVPARVVGNSQGALKVRHGLVTKDGLSVLLPDFVQAIRSAPW